MKNKDTHKRKMQAYKKKVDATIARANKQKSVVVLMVGEGKGKTTSAFGMVMRSLGYGHRVGIVQFIKGVQKSGEEHFVARHPGVTFYQMGTGFTWDTQNRQSDSEAAWRTWQQAENMLCDEQFQLVVLDELTYMLSYRYLLEEQVIDAILKRPKNQSVVVTGRGGGERLRDIADTVSEIKQIKHAYHSGIQARQGVDW